MVVNPIFFSAGTALLLLMLSEWSISPSTPSEWQHLQACSSQAATVLLCNFIPLPCGPDPLCSVDPSAPHNLSSAYLSVTEIPAVNHSTANQAPPSVWITPTVKEVRTTVFPPATHASITAFSTKRMDSVAQLLMVTSNYTLIGQWTSASHPTWHLRSCSVSSNMQDSLLKKCLSLPLTKL